MERLQCINNFLTLKSSRGKLYNKKYQVNKYLTFVTAMRQYPAGIYVSVLSTRVLFSDRMTKQYQYFSQNYFIVLENVLQNRKFYDTTYSNHTCLEHLLEDLQYNAIFLKANHDDQFYIKFSYLTIKCFIFLWTSFYFLTYWFIRIVLKIHIS